MNEYKHELYRPENPSLIVIDPATLSPDQKSALLLATTNYVKGKNFWHIKREDPPNFWAEKDGSGKIIGGLIEIK